MSGKITYNGHSLNEFVPQRTSAYVSQQDWHVAEMTVRETLDFSARCQGVGCKYGIYPGNFDCLCLCACGSHLYAEPEFVQQICLWNFHEERR